MDRIAKKIKGEEESQKKRKTVCEKIPD